MIRGSPLSQLNLELESEAAPQGKVPMRRCVVTGHSVPRDDLLRFVASPDGVITFDVKGKLEGRGVWVSPNKEHLLKAMKQNMLARGAKQKVTIPDDLIEKVEAALKQRVLNLLKRAQLSGEMVQGHEKCLSQLQALETRLLVHAEDASEDGMKKLDKHIDSPAKVMQFGSRDELASVLNSANPVHMAVRSANLAKVIYAAYAVWARFIGRDGL